MPENDTSSDADGVPAHGIWVIAENGADLDIGKAIHAKKIPVRHAGRQSVTVDRPNGTTFIAKFRPPDPEDLYIKLTIIPLVAGVTFDTTPLKTQLAAPFPIGLNQTATIGEVIVAMLQLAPSGSAPPCSVPMTASPMWTSWTRRTFNTSSVTDPARIDITA